MCQALGRSGVTAAVTSPGSSLFLAASFQQGGSHRQVLGQRKETFTSGVSWREPRQTGVGDLLGDTRATRRGAGALPGERAAVQRLSGRQERAKEGEDSERARGP